ncbi:response regulator [Hyphomicrobium sp. CS1GBMeth3]|uniref:response regulator n=1 Tax=Hyphomicrobium sp. CS1GBMeth3 TaxID=1892845 RepID=UPI0009304590|nr:response regulator [Hyphomicrobium sp. CS1GBMeth3]
MHSHLEEFPIEVLIVDDEPQAVKYFQRAFGNRFPIVTATSAAEAEELLMSDEHNIGVVVSDQRMPHRSGVSLLESIRRRRPDVVRILTTAYADLDDAVRAVNQGGVFRYIMKPWDLQALEADLEQATTFYLMQRECNLLINEKLGAMERTVLRNRLYSLAAMSVALSGYKNAPVAMRNYLKDALAETAWRPAIRKQWSELRSECHWRLPVEEAQRLVQLSRQLVDDSTMAHHQDHQEAELVSVVSNCASALRDAHNKMSVSVRSEVDELKVPTNAAHLADIMKRLMAPMSDWTAPGSTLLVQVRNGKDNGGGAVIDFEMRNFDPAKALEDCVLHAAPFEDVSQRSVEYLRAILAVGHMGGSVSSMPSGNGFKRIELVLPTDANDARQNATVDADWLEEINEEYERWSLGMLDIAS